MLSATVQMIDTRAAVLKYGLLLGFDENHRVIPGPVREDGEKVIVCAPAGWQFPDGSREVCLGNWFAMRDFQRRLWDDHMRRSTERTSDE